MQFFLLVVVVHDLLRIYKARSVNLEREDKFETLERFPLIKYSSDHPLKNNICSKK